MWTPINTLHAGPVRGRMADPGMKGPTPLYLMGSSSAGPRNKEIPECSGSDYLGPATASPFFASRGASIHSLIALLIVFKTSCCFLFSKAEWCGNGTCGGGGKAWGGCGGWNPHCGLFNCEILTQCPQSCCGPWWQW